MSDTPVSYHDRASENHHEDFDKVIEQGSSSGGYWRELWKYRELFYFMAWRDILVRYKQTAIGIGWGLIRPLMTMVVFSIVFGKIAALPSEGSAPYSVMVFAALLPWQLFSNALTESSNSLVVNASILSKIYFPRLVVPASAVIVNLIDSLISMAVLALIMMWYGIMPDWRFLTIPLFLLLVVALVFGIGSWLASLNVKYRDFRHIVPFLVQIGLFISPVGFSSSIIPDDWRLLYSLNPMVGIIDGFRWAILGNETVLDLRALALTVTETGLFLVLGVAFFRKTERQFADVI